MDAELMKAIAYPDKQVNKNALNTQDAGVMGEGGQSYQIRKFMHSLQKENAALYAACAT